MVLGFPVIPRGDLYTRPHVSGDFCIGKFFYADTPSVHTCPPYTLSRVEISVYAVYPDTCGRSYPYIFVYVDVTVSEPVFFRARFSKMAASRNVVCSMLLGLLSSLIACLELNVAMLNLNFNYLRRRLSIMRLLAISDSGIRRQRLLKRAGRQLARPRRFWVRPGRTSAWWGNFVVGIMIEEEWRENFRMSRGSLYKLADELRPHCKN